MTDMTDKVYIGLKTYSPHDALSQCDIVLRTIGHLIGEATHDSCTSAGLTLTEEDGYGLSLLLQSIAHGIDRASEDISNRDRTEGAPSAERVHEIAEEVNVSKEIVHSVAFALFKRPARES